MNRIEVGNRVRSNEGFGPLPHEGVIQAIVVGLTSQGPTAVLKVLVDKRDGAEVPPQVQESPATHWDHLSADGTTTSTVGDKLPTAKCGSCGEVHGEGRPDPFTPEMIHLHAQLPTASDEAKEQIYAELAMRFMNEVSALDPELPDGIHKLISKAQEAHTKAEKAVLRVARLVVRNLDERARRVESHRGRGPQLFVVPIGGPETEKKSEKPGLN